MNNKLRENMGKDAVRAAKVVGYTNAGKSTIMNSLTDAQTTVENKLFATLDTTTRKLFLNKFIYFIRVPITTIS